MYYTIICVQTPNAYGGLIIKVHDKNRPKIDPKYAFYFKNK